MYCKNCGRKIYDDTEICPYCSTPTHSHNNFQSQDKPSIGFGILGFFIPLVGFILYLVYKDKSPKKAKSAGKGAIAGVIVNIVLSIVYAIAIFWIADNVIDNTDFGTMMTAPDVIYETPENQVDIAIGEFEVSNNGYFDTTSLEVTVKNTSDVQMSYYITIEAVNENGTRLKTDTVAVSQLNPGQDIVLSAFKYVEPELIEELRNAEFKVLDIQQFDF